MPVESYAGTVPSAQPEADSAVSALTEDATAAEIHSPPPTLTPALQTGDASGQSCGCSIENSSAGVPSVMLELSVQAAADGIADGIAEGTADGSADEVAVTPLGRGEMSSLTHRSKGENTVLWRAGDGDAASGQLPSRCCRHTEEEGVADSDPYLELLKNGCCKGRPDSVFGSDMSLQSSADQMLGDEDGAATALIGGYVTEESSKSGSEDPERMQV